MSIWKISPETQPTNTVNSSSLAREVTAPVNRLDLTYNSIKIAIYYFRLPQSNYKWFNLIYITLIQVYIVRYKHVTSVKHGSVGSFTVLDTPTFKAFDRFLPPCAVNVASRIRHTLPSPDPTINSSGLISSIQRAPDKIY